MSKENKKEQDSSFLSKESTKSQSSSVLSKESTKSQSSKSSSGINNFYIKYNIDQKIIDEINDDKDKFNLLLELIYKYKKKELKELTQSPFVIKRDTKTKVKWIERIKNTPYTKENENESILRI